MGSNLSCLILGGLQMFWFSVRWSVYCSIAFFVALGIALPMARFFAVTLVISYLMYSIWDTVKNALDVEDATDDFKIYLIKSAILNTPDFICFAISVAVGIFVGVTR